MNGPLLVILPYNPGDVAMALAAIARIRAALPALAVDYVVGEECRELAQGNPLLRKVHVLPRKALREAWSAGDAGAVTARTRAFLADLDSEDYAFSLNLFQERSGGVLQGLLRARRKSGLELAGGGRFRVGSRFLEHLFAVPAARRDNGWHAVDLYVRAARDLLGPSGTWPQPAPREAARPGMHPRPGPHLLPPLAAPPGWQGPEAGAYLAFHPGSAWPGKRWPEGHWAGLAAACVRAGTSVVMTGSSEEQPSLRRILEALPPAVRIGVHDWSGRTSLLGAAWIHSRARMTVTGDTVAMHLAAACGTPTLALFGPSNPVETGPYGQGHFILQTEAELPADLALDSPHAGLAALSPRSVAAFILEGAAPPEAALWETGWDAERDRQVLRDARGRIHPHQRGSLGLMDFLDGRTDGPAPGRIILPPGPRAAVRDRLDRCLAGACGSGDLAALEAADRALEAVTRDSLVWEAYRVAINGLDLEDIRRHLGLRRDRFELAVREEAALALTSGASEFRKPSGPLFGP